MKRTMKKNNKGFTLAELLIVVAIIAVLVAVAIPTFSTQLEKSKERVDEANCRSAYAEAVANYLTNDIKDHKVTINNTEYTWSYEESSNKTTISSTKGESKKYENGITYDGSEFKKVEKSNG